MKKKIVLFLLLFSAHAPAYAHKALNILFVVQQYPAMDTFVVNQVQGLARCGHTISVLAFKHKADDAPCDLSEDLIKDVFYGRAVPKCGSYDVILCQFLPLARLGWELRESGHGGKLVVMVRGGSDNLLEDDSAYARAFHAKLRNEVDLMLPVCDYFKKQLLKVCYQEDKIQVVPTGIDVDVCACAQRSSHAGSIQLLSIGHLIERKGFEYAIRAVAQVARTHPHIHYTIIGSGPMHAQLQALINQLNAAHVITLAGHKKHAEVIGYLHKSHIFIAPSVMAHGYGEGIPTVLKEAMACGMPVIATAHVGIPELVCDGKSGFLVPERNVHALVERLELLINSPHRWTPLGLAARAAVEQKHVLREEIENLNNVLCALAG